MAMYVKINTTELQSRLNIKKKAYTIKELAITFCVLGITICAILTSMLNRIQKFSFSQEYKNQFAAVSQAYERLKNDLGGDLTGYFRTNQNNATATIVQQLGNYLNYKKACVDGNGSYYTYICGTNPLVSLKGAYKTYVGKSFNMNNLAQGQYFMKDGANIYFRSFDSSSLLVFVDVNGYSQGPNVLGKDLLGMTIMGNRVYPMGAGGTGVEGTCTKIIEKYCGHGFYCPTEDISGASCAFEILYK